MLLVLILAGAPSVLAFPQALPSNVPKADVATVAARLLAASATAQCNGSSTPAAAQPLLPPAAAAAAAERRRLVATAQQGLELLSAGRYHTCGVAVTPASGVRRVVCWGASVNTGGDFDNCGQTNVPSDLAADASSVLQVSAGGYSTCALIAGGTLRC